ncbi:CU044_2847 family protein [Coleofasciculus sp. F4-SAH-05]|uniref:CU044_2847 family protein n=1 Tax=Coleofasciculus sp. F4-SAH-05 TaxID=3069525 RepID=UPI0032F9DB31
MGLEKTFEVRRLIMAQQLLELDTDDGGTILVAVDVPESAVGQVATPGEPPIKKLDRSFNVIQALIVRGCRPLTKAFQQLHRETQATDAEVEFGINFTAKGNVYLVESSGTATLKVKVSWKMDQQKR